MDGRHDDVRGCLPGQLDDVFAHVGFQRLDAGGFQRVIETDFLADHRLALDEARGLGARSDAEHDGIGLGRGLGPVHRHAIRRQARFELFQQLGQIGQGVAANCGAEIAQHVQFVGVAELGAALGLEEIHGAAKTAAQGDIIDRGAAALGEIPGGMKMHGLAHAGKIS